jgi:hypothetical protein
VVPVTTGRNAADVPELWNGLYHDLVTTAYFPGTLRRPSP